MELATEMQFATLVPHEMTSMYDESGNQNKIFNASSTGNEICEESCNLNEIYNAKRSLVVNELKSVELNLPRNLEPKFIYEQ